MNLNTIKKFIKKILFIKPVNTQNGLTLLEMLIVIGLFAILISISFVTYRAVTKNVAIKTFKQVSELFPIALTTCIASSGWKVTTPAGVPVYPCTDLTSPPDSAAALSKLGYTCPAGTSPSDNTCNFWSNTTTGYVCLNVQKKIKGKTYEIHVIVNRNNRNDYTIFCSDEDGDVTSPQGIDGSICTDPASSSSSYGPNPCDW